jgi:hypothetical protein
MLEEPERNESEHEGNSLELVIATPCYGGVATTLYLTSLLKLERACRARGLSLGWVFVTNDSLIPRARAELVAMFLANPRATHMLFIDADIGFDPEQVFRLMAFDADFVAGSAPIKKLDWDKLRRVVVAGAPKPESTALTYVLGIDNVGKVEARDGFAKVRAVGNAFLMLRRSALLRMCAAHPELKYDQIHSPGFQPTSDHRYALFECMVDPKTRAYLSEDFAFCRRWTDLGGDIWLDLQSQLTHVGPTEFVGDLSTQFRPAGTPPLRSVR